MERDEGGEANEEGSAKEEGGLHLGEGPFWGEALERRAFIRRVERGRAPSASQVERETVC